MEQEIVYGGGGEITALLRLRAADLLALIGAEVVPVC